MSAPIILVQPVGSTANVQSITLSVTARAANAVTSDPAEAANYNLQYRWYKSMWVGGAASLVATGRIYSFALSAATRGFYYVEVWNGGSFVKSDVVLVSRANLPALITRQPERRMVTGTTPGMTLSVEYFGVANQIYWFNAWQRASGGNEWDVNVVGVGAVLHLDGTSNAMVGGATQMTEGAFYCVLGGQYYEFGSFVSDRIGANNGSFNQFNGGGSLNSPGERSENGYVSRVTLSVNDKLYPVSPEGFSESVPEIRVELGAELNLALATPSPDWGGAGWHRSPWRGPDAIFGHGWMNQELSSTLGYHIESVQESDFDGYAITVGFSRFYFKIKNISFVRIITQPVSQTVGLGQAFSLGLEISGVSSAQDPIQYQWKKNGRNVTQNGASATYYVNSVTEADFGSYTVVLSNSNGEVESQAAVITQEPPVLKMQPQAVRATQGGGAVLRVEVEGRSGDVAYQWQKSGVDIPEATTSVLTLSNLSEASFGFYRVLVTNEGGSTASVQVSVSDGAALPPAVVMPVALAFQSGELVNIPIFSNAKVSVWEASGLPEGMLLDAANGRIRGTSMTAGVYLVAVTGRNLYGSDRKDLLLQVAPESKRHETGADLEVDLETRSVKTDWGAFKTGDDVILFVRFVKNGAPVALGVSELYFTLMGEAGQAPLVISPIWAKHADGAGEFYVLRFGVDTEAVQGVLADAEAGERAEVRAFAEFSWVANNPWFALGLEPEHYTGSSRIFPVRMVRQLA